LLRDNQQCNMQRMRRAHLLILCAHEDYYLDAWKRAYLGRMSQPCRIREPMVNHKQLRSLKRFSRRSGFLLHGCGLYHSYGVNLNSIIPKTLWSNDIQARLLLKLYFKNLIRPKIRPFYGKLILIHMMDIVILYK